MIGDADTRVGAAVASGRTQQIALITLIPVYIAYFLANYHRDPGASGVDDNEKCDR